MDFVLGMIVGVFGLLMYQEMGKFVAAAQVFARETTTINPDVWRVPVTSDE